MRPAGRLAYKKRRPGARFCMNIRPGSYLQRGGAMVAEQKKRTGRPKAHWMDLPVELKINQPRVTVIGQGPAFVENHGGLLAYTPKEICFRAGSGAVCIRGKALMLDHMSGGAVRIGGRIDSVTWQGETEHAR